MVFHGFMVSFPGDVFSVKFAILVLLSYKRPFPAPPKGCFLVGFMKLKTSEKDPFGGAGLEGIMWISVDFLGFCLRQMCDFWERSSDRLLPAMCLSFTKTVVLRGF